MASRPATDARACRLLHFWHGRFGGGLGQSSSSGHGQVISPFGGVPYGQASGFARSFSNPLRWGFGETPTSARGQNFLSGLESDTSPLAAYIRQGRDFLPGVFNQAQQVGTDVASRAPGLFNQFQGQISSLLSQLPNFQRAAGEQSGLAQDALRQSFSPIASQALFQNALRSTLDQSRAGAAGRGLLDAGTQQGQEEALTRDLAQGYAQNQFGQQQQALSGAQQALGTQATLQGAGIGPAQEAMAALPQLQQMLAAGYQVPMDALSQVFGQLSATQSPTLALLSQILPQIAQKSSAKQGNIL